MYNEEKGLQARALGHNCGNWRGVRSEGFEMYELRAA